MAIIRNAYLTNVSDLIFCLDAVNTKSYPGTGSTWYDVSGNNNHFTLYNNPTYVPWSGSTTTVQAYVGLPITSMLFPGSTQYLSATTSTTWLVGGADFTIEAWIYLTGYSPGYTSIYTGSIATNQQSNTNSVGWQFNVFGSASAWTGLQFVVNPGLVVQSGSYSFSLNTWYHVAVTKNASTTTLFVNGNPVGSGTTISTWTDYTTLNIGRLDYTGYNFYLPGYISNLRIIRGQAHYTGTFTASTSVLSTTESSRTNVQALTTGTWTVFLLNSSTFVDSSDYARPVTNNGASIVTTPAPPITTPTGPVIVPVVGGYFTFNGTNQYASSTNAINWNNYSAVTFEIGYRSTSTATQVLFETTGTGGSTVTGGISLVMNTNSTSSYSDRYLSTWWGDGHRIFSFTPSTNTIFNSVINQYVNGVDSTGRQAYVNGNTSSWFTITNTLATSAATTTSGGISFANTWTYLASRSGTSNFFKGDIAYVRAWGKKLTQTDISRNVETQKALRTTSFTGESISVMDLVAGSVLYSTTGTYSWTAPAGVTSVCVVCIGGGASGSGYFGVGGGGGALAYKNNISVTPGNSYSLTVGAGGVATGSSTSWTGQNGGTSSFTAGFGTISANGGIVTGGVTSAAGYGTGGAPNGVYDSGGSGGSVPGAYSSGLSAGANTSYYGSGGGGAGGYSGAGGNGGGAAGGAANGTYTPATDGSGGGGGGGQGQPANNGITDYDDGGGGGVNPYGQGTSGLKGVQGTVGGTAYHAGGYGGSGGQDGVSPQANTTLGNGGLYGGGGGSNHGNSSSTPPGSGARGCVRIIWGANRSFPSTGDLSAINETTV